MQCSVGLVVLLQVAPKFNTGFVYVTLHLQLPPAAIALGFVSVLPVALYMHAPSPTVYL